MSKKRFFRRGNTIVMVAVCMPLLLGFAALGIDVSMLYSTKAQLQRTADAAALAGALQLGNNKDGNALARSKQAVIDLGVKNEVLGQPLQFDISTDYTSGVTNFDPSTKKYVFDASTVKPNAVKVRARRTADSPSGPVPLFFAHIFGKSWSNLEATATATLIPRDIVFVMDVSGSHAFNSMLVTSKYMEIANRPVWTALWDSQYGPQQFDAQGMPLGPTFGNMRNWGDAVTGGPGVGINPNDPGLLYLPKANWSLTPQFVNQTIVEKGFAPYTANQMMTINQGATDATTYKCRVLIALGIYRYKGTGSSSSGGTIKTTDVETIVPYPSALTNPDTKCGKVGGTWEQMVDYVSTNCTQNGGMAVYDPTNYYWGDTRCQYRFGLKTWLDNILTNYRPATSSPALANSGQQPMTSVTDGVLTSIDIIRDLDSCDYVGTAAFCTQGWNPSTKPGYLSWLTDDFNTVQSQVVKLHAGMWLGATCTAGGIDEGVNVLFGCNSRAYASKVMILLTDGQPNYTKAGANSPATLGNTNTTAYKEAEASADAAAAKGVIIHTVGVGTAATDPTLAAWLKLIATKGKGTYSSATGSIDEYHALLQEIMKSLGGKRPVVLIQ
ncbi:MAG: pilus assembly protein TadG-related protein [Phycisphaerae bacterium]|nr:pilus assembly protein TadG-related protein [Phycisphaerae bacterium]